jgi:hypothetical protein
MTRVCGMCRRWRCTQALVERPESNRPLGRPRHRWDDNIETASSRSGVEGHGLDWSGSGLGGAVGSCELDDKPLGSIKCGEFLDYLRTG